MSSFAPGGPEPPLPTPPELEEPPANFKSVGKEVAEGVGDSSLVADFWLKAEDALIEMLASATAWFLTRIANLVGFFVKLWVRVRVHMEEPIAEFASLAVSDLFGTAMESAAFARVGERAGRKEVGHIVGQQILKSVLGEFAQSRSGDLQPSDEPAAQYLAAMADFSVEGWFEGAMMEAFSLHYLEKAGELKDVILNVFGFGRLTRRVLGPAIDTLITTPYEWKLNKQFRPKLLTSSQLVRQYHRGRLTAEQVSEELARQGYSEERIDALVNEGSKFLGVTELAFLERNGYWTAEQTLAHLRDQGYSESIATTLLEIERVQRIDTAKNELVSAATQSFVSRDIDKETYLQLLDTVGMQPEVRRFVLLSAGLRREFNIKRLTASDAEQAVKKGFWSLRQYTDYLKDQGFSDDDVTTKQLLVQDEIRAEADAAKKRADADRERAAEKAARADAARQRQAELEAQRARRDLTLSQVQRAFVRGLLTEDQYRDFLVREKIAPGDIAILIELASADRADYVDASDRRAAADRKLAATRLTSAELERAVEVGALSMEDYRKILTDQGVEPADIEILVKLLRTNIDERATAEARRRKVAEELATRELSLPQFESAVRRGLRTIADYKQFLAKAGYPAEDQEILAGLLQSTLDADRAAEAKRKEVEARLTTRRISLGDLEQAVRRGIRTMDDYRAALQAEGIVPGDIATLVTLLQSKIDDDRAAEARRKAVEARLAQKGISLSDLERAVRLGVVGIERYQLALSREGIPAEDQAILLALLRSDIAETAAARAQKQAAEEKLRNRPVSLADLERGVQLGLRTPADYKRALAAEGFAPDAQDLLAQLLEQQIAEVEAQKKQNAEREALRVKRPAALADVERAVRLGVRTLADYRTALVASDLTPAAQELLASVLEAELAEMDAARKRRAELDAQKTTRELTRAELERAIKAGVRQEPDYRWYLQQHGYDLIDQITLENLLLKELG